MNDTLDERLRLFTDQLLIENTAVWANGYPNAIVGFIIVDESRMPDRLWRSLVGLCIDYLQRDLGMRKILGHDDRGCKGESLFRCLPADFVSGRDVP